ncbi:hypothetical protein OHV90_17350 [Acinetobacter baumannii]|nr:hypothetical protein [Acinetobacter baumannii]
MDYPKMLYKGDLVNFDFCVASSEDREEELKSEGWIEHHELEEPEEGPEDIKTTEEPEEIDLSAYVPVEQFDVIAEKLTQTEEQLGEKTIELEKAQGQITSLEGQHAEVILNLEGEVNRLKEELAAAPAASGVPQEVYDAVYQEREQLKQENAQLKYSAMGANELRAILDEKGVKYGSRDEKPALVKLVLDNQ